MKWKMVKLGDVITFRGGGTPRKDVPEYWSDEIPWATVKDFKGLVFERTRDFISPQGLASSASNLIPSGHVIIPTRMALGKAEGAMNGWSARGSPKRFRLVGRRFRRKKVHKVSEKIRYMLGHRI